MNNKHVTEMMQQNCIEYRTAKTGKPTPVKGS